MYFTEAAMLGLIQGITEWLPVSSSGHLALLHNHIGKGSPTYDFLLHLATLLIVIVYYRDKIVKMLKNTVVFLQACFKMESEGECRYKEREEHKHNKAEQCRICKNFLHFFKTQQDFRLAICILISSVPTAVVGFGLKISIYDLVYSSNLFIGLGLVFTGTALILTLNPFKSTMIKEIGVSHALIIGICQGIAVLPGISRSGITISAAILLGIQREKAAEFSFLISIPAIAGAGFLSLLDIPSIPSSDYIPALVGVIVCIISGYAAIKLLLKMVQKKAFHLFSPYCLLLGFLMIVLNL
ncbi:MAG: undecaprenyl-diphosphate phosphatase [Thermoplasmata archaeon]